MKSFKESCLMTVLKVTKRQVFTISLEDTFMEKPQGVQIDLQPFRG